MFGNKSFIYDVRIKKCIIRTQPPLPSLSANMQVWPEPTLFLDTMFTVLIHIVKMTGKSTDFQRATFCERLMYLQCFHFGTVEYSSTLKEITRELSIWQKKDICIRKCGFAKAQKNIPKSPFPKMNHS